MTLYFQKDGQVENMFCSAFVDINLSMDTRKERSAPKTVFKWRAENATVLVQAMLHPSPFDVQLHFRAFLFWKDYLQRSCGQHCTSRVVVCGFPTLLNWRLWHGMRARWQLNWGASKLLSRGM